MCGIGGIISSDKINNDQATFFEGLMINLQSRGRSAFGMVSYPKLNVIKTKGDVDDYLKDNKTISNIIVDENYSLGHTRATTKGTEQNNENNHPFETKDFILAHNGIISNDEKIREYFKLKGDAETDSYAIIALIQHFYDNPEDGKDKNIIASISEARNYLSGSYACWIIHKETGTIYLFKSINATLNIGYIRPWNTIIFASEISNFLDLEKKYFPKSNRECGLFNTNLIVRQIDEDKIYRINKLNNDKDWITIFKYESKSKAYDLNNFRCGKDDIDDEDEDIKAFQCSVIKNDYDFDEVLGILKKYGIECESEIPQKKLKLTIPEYLKEDVRRLGFTFGKSDKNSIRIKIRSAEKILNKIMDIAEKNDLGTYQYQSPYTNSVSEIVDGLDGLNTLDKYKY